MGYEGTLRSIGAGMRAMEREAQHRQRELERQLKQAQKEEAVAAAALEVEVFDNRIDVLTSVHKECSQEIDWRTMAEADPPQEPNRSDSSEREAQQRLDGYEPSLWDRLTKRQEKKLEALERQVETARSDDDESYRRAQQRYLKEYTDWQETHDLARRVVSHDADAFLDVPKKLDPFSDISELGSHITFVMEDEVPHATLHVGGRHVVPRESKTLLKSGKLSVKEMPKSRYYALYQDYACSCLLRVASELLAMLPVSAVVVTAVDTMLNTRTGHMEEQPIVSAVVPGATLRRLDLQTIDPSDSMENFVHNMSFKKTQGFSAVEPVDASGLALSGPEA